MTPPPLTDDLAAQLTALAHQQGLTHAVLADRLNLSRQRIGQILSGDARTLDVYARVADALGVDLVIELRPR